jgi:hypothetical protein
MSLSTGLPACVKHVHDFPQLRCLAIKHDVTASGDLLRHAFNAGRWLARLWLIGQLRGLGLYLVLQGCLCPGVSVAKSFQPITWLTMLMKE